MMLLHQQPIACWYDRGLVLITSLSEKLDRCIGRIDSLETELGSTKKIMRGAILTLVSRVKKLEKTVKQLRTTRLVALGPDQTAVPSENVEEREEEEVPLRRKRSAYRRARTAFSTPAFEQFQAHLSASSLRKRSFEAEQASGTFGSTCYRCRPWSRIYMHNVSEERAKELDELMMRMTETDWLNLMMQVGSNPALARELLGADVTEDNFIECFDLNKQMIEEEGIFLCRRLEKDRLLSAQYNLFRPKPAITEPPSKRQRVVVVSNPAGSALVLQVYLTPTVPTPAAMDSAGSHHEIGISPFADSADSSSPSNVSTDHIPIDGLFYISGAGVVVVDKLPDDEIVDPRVKVETVSDYASSPPRSESESDDDMEHYIPPLPYGEFQDWEMVSCAGILAYTDDWIVSSWQLYPKSSVHVLDLTNGKTMYMFVDKVYPIRAILLERMLRHRLTVPPSYCRDVVVAGNIIRTVQDGLRQAYECLASAPISPWLTANKESGSPLQTALVCNSNPLIVD
ncbi:hypothetical protein Tco_0441632 [Tanacetum coccineum]